MSEVLFKCSEGIAVVTLNRPEKHNALSPEVIIRLSDAWRAIADDPTVRVAILTGAGARSFCAGGDLGRLLPLLMRHRPPEDEWDERLLADRSQFDAALLRNATFFKPVVAAVNGYALAGGTELMLGTDIRIASADATFGLTEVRRGIIPGGGSLTRLARQISWTQTMELVLCAEPITADHAMQIGLVNRVVPADEVMPTARRIAETISQGAPIALLKAKEAIVRSNGRPLEEAFAIEDSCTRAVSKTEDAREGPLAFMQKRAPKFVGR